MQEILPFGEVRPAILGAWFYAPLEAVGGPAELDRLKGELTIVGRFAESEDDVMRLWTERLPGYIGVPRAFGRERFAGLPIDDRRIEGGVITSVTKRPDPNHPKVLDPAAQAAFMRNIHGAMVGLEDVLAGAPTGSGKTVSFLDAAASYARTTLILVHLERLADQWAEEIHDKLGVPFDRIGKVQGPICQWEGKDFAVGILNSVSAKMYPPAFYRHWGVVCFDEVHKVGSPFFSQAICKFPAKVRIGLSATMKRKDGTERVYYHHLGPVRVQSTAQALPIKVYVLKHVTRSELWGRDHGSRMKCLTLDRERNDLIVRAIKRMFDAGRQALVVSEGVEHLQNLMTLAEQAGVPRGVMGQFTGQSHRKTNEFVIDANGRKRRKVVKTKLKAETLKGVKENAQIIFATYGMIKEGIDIPRLDAGIDATPRGDATQLIGRVRRPVPGKKDAVWITINDVRCVISSRYFKKRLKDYLASGAEVVGYGIQNASPNSNPQPSSPQAEVRNAEVVEGPQPQAA